MKHFLLLFMLSTLSVGSYGQIVAEWNPDGTIGSSVTNLNLTGFSRGTSASMTSGGTFNSNGFDATDLASAKAEGDYIEFSVDVASGYILDISEIQFRLDRSGTGPANFSFEYSSDNFTTSTVITTSTSLGVIGDSGTNFTSDSAIDNLSGNIIFRIYAWGASSSGGTMDIEGISGTSAIIVSGTVSLSSATPTVTLSIDNTTISENGGTASITATLSAATSEDVDVTLETSGTAAAGDFTLAPTTITILAGQTTGTATLTGTDDGAVEGDETVIIDIASVSDADEDGTQQVTVTLQDDDVSSSITAMATCSGAADNNFHILVTGLIASETYDITVGGALVADDFTGETSYTTTTPINFVDGKTKTTVEINDGTTTTTILVNEILCEDIDGVTGFDNAAAVCVDNDGEALFQAAPHTGENVVVYVLTDETGIVEQVNYSGRFSELADGEYEIYPVNVADATDAATLVSELTVGVDVDSNNDNTYDFAPSANICEIGCGFTTFTIGCDCPLSITTQPTDDAVCAGEDVSFSFVVDPTSDITISWEMSTDNGSTFAAISPVESAATLSLSGVNTGMNNNQYRAVITYDNGTTECTVTSNPATLTVNPLPTATDAALAVCDDNADGLAQFTLTDANADILGGQTGMTITFHATQEDADSGDGDLSSTFTNTMVNTQTIYVRVENSLGCHATAPITLTVDPRPTLEITTANASLCSTEAAAAISIEATANGTLAWTSSEGTDLSGTTTSPLSYTIADVNNSPITITATVTGEEACSAVVRTKKMMIEVENVECIQFPWAGN